MFTTTTRFRVPRGAIFFVVAAATAFAETWVNVGQPDWWETTGVALSSDGRAVGTYYHSYASGQFIQTGDRIETFLLPNNAVARGVNDSGQVVANDYNGGYIRYPTGRFSYFLGPSGQSLNVAGVNNRGEIAGHLTSLGVGYVRSRFGEFTILQLASSPTVTGINANGQTVGTVVDFDGVQKAFLCTNGLCNLFVVPRATETHALGIASSGDVTGFCVLDGVRQGFVRSPGGRITVFAMPAATETVPVGINSTGEIIGHFYSDSYGRQAFRRDATGATSPIQVPGAVEANPVAINDAGVMLINYRDYSYSARSVLRMP